MTNPALPAPAPVAHWTTLNWGWCVHDVTIGGGRVRYLDLGAGAPIVLIHGLGGSWHSWLENIPELAADHRVIAVDLPGFGGSDPLQPPAAMTSYAETIAELLESLEIEQATLVGHSMGGLVSLHLAATRPDLVARLVLVNAGGVRLSRARLRAIVRGFVAVNALFGREPFLRQVARRGHLRRAAMALFLADTSRLSPQLAAEIIPRMAAPGLVGAVIAASRQVGVTQPDDILCPVLLIWGAKDRLLPLSLAQGLAADLPDGRLEVLDGVGHCPMIEAPGAFDRALRAFADEDGSGRAD